MEQRLDPREVVRASLKKQCGDHFQRRLVGELTGNMIAAKTCANHDSAGTGVPNSFRVNSKICYFVDDFVDWLFDDVGQEG